MPPKDDKKKDAGKLAKKDKDPVNKSGGKAKKKKWSKGKVRDKLNNLVLFDKATYDKLCKEVPNYKLITPAVVSERLKIRGSLARAALQELLSKGLLKLGSKHRAQVFLHQKHKGWRRSSCWWRCTNRFDQLYIWENKTLLNQKKKLGTTIN